MKRGLAFLLVGFSLVSLLTVGVLAANDVIKIGSAVSLTGAMAPEGTMVQKGEQLWADYVNSHGGINVGGKQYKVQVIYYDDQSDAGTGTKLTQKLITEDKVDFLFGPFSSGITFATTAIGEKYKVITIAPEANATKIYNRGYKYVFSILPPAPTLTQPILALAATLQPKPEKVAIIVANDLFPLSAAQGAKEKAEQLGFNVVAFEKYPAGATDITTLLTLVKAKNPDILLDCGYTKDALMVVRQMREVDFNVKMLAFAVGVMLPQFVESLGSDANYAYEGEWWLPSLKDKGPVFGNTQTYVKLFENKFGEKPDYHASSGSAAGVVLQLAIEKAGSLNTEAVRQALKSLDVKLAVWPGIKFNDKGQNVKTEHPVIQVQNGKFVVVWPPLNPPLYPMPPWSKR